MGIIYDRHVIDALHAAARGLLDHSLYAEEFVAKVSEAVRTEPDLAAPMIKIEINRLKKWSNEIVAVLDEAALKTERRYNEGGASIVKHYARELRRIHDYAARHLLGQESWEKGK